MTAKARTTISLDPQVLTALRIHAARTGKGDSQVIEEAVRHYLGLDVFENLWSKNDLDEGEAMGLALEAQRAARRTRRSNAG